MRIKTELPQKEFRWNDEMLEQKIEIIQHFKEKERDVGLYIEWQKVVCNGKSISKKEE